MDAARAGLRRCAPGGGEESGAEARPVRLTPGLEWEPRRRSDADGGERLAASRLASSPTGVPSISALSRSRATRSCDAIAPRDAYAPPEGRRPPWARGLARRLAPFRLCSTRRHRRTWSPLAVASEITISARKDRTTKVLSPLPIARLPLAHTTRVRALASRPQLALDAIARHDRRAVRLPARQRGDVGGRCDVRKRRPRALLAPTKRGREDRANHVYRRGARRTDDGRARRDAARRVSTRRRLTEPRGAFIRRDATRVGPLAGGGGLRPLPVGSTRVRHAGDETQNAVRGVRPRVPRRTSRAH